VPVRGQAAEFLPGEFAIEVFPVQRPIIVGQRR
jgi:hypothetical protein